MPFSTSVIIKLHRIEFPNSKPLREQQCVCIILAKPVQDLRRFFWHACNVTNGTVLT